MKLKGLLEMNYGILKKRSSDNTSLIDQWELE